MQKLLIESISNPKLANKYAIPPVIGVVKTIGIKKIGFNIIGTPNTIGSLILNKQVQNDNLNIALNVLILLLPLKLLILKIFPFPPIFIVIKTTINTRCGKLADGVPAINASTLAVIQVINTGV